MNSNSRLGWLFRSLVLQVRSSCQREAPEHFDRYRMRSALLKTAAVCATKGLALASEGQRSQLPVLNPEPHLARSEATQDSINP